VTGAAMTTLAFAEPFTASGAAVAVWFVSATGKELGPRGYERVKYLGGWW
jgi:hypothetical protein